LFGTGLQHFWHPVPKTSVWSLTFRDCVPLYMNTGQVAQLSLAVLKNTSSHENSHFSTPAENAHLGILSVSTLILKINSFDIQSFLLERFICSTNHFKPLWHLLTHRNCCA